MINQRVITAQSVMFELDWVIDKMDARSLHFANPFSSATVVFELHEHHVIIAATDRIKRSSVRLTNIEFDNLRPHAIKSFVSMLIKKLEEVES